MDLDHADIALLVSGLSAVGALANVTVAGMTYKRVKPKVRVIVEDHGMSPKAPKPQQERDYRMRIRLVNRGALAIRVERIHVTPVHEPWWRWWDRAEERPGGQRFLEPLVIDPVGGVKHWQNVRPSALLRQSALPRYIYVTAWLTDGSKVLSKPVRDLSGLVLDIGPAEPAPQPPARGWRGWLGRLTRRNR